MTILDKIIAKKVQEVSVSKLHRSIAELENCASFQKPSISLKQHLLNSTTGIIAEFKRKSPSKGWIAENADAAIIPYTYQQAGASGLSILTDNYFFGGAEIDILQARSKVSLPILRKDFMIDEYQFIEAKAMGADVVLLIAASLTPKQVKNFTKFAHSLSLEVLLEIHNQQELAHICDEVDMVGVNNRNLKDFAVDIQYSFDLADKIPSHIVKISESGLSQVNDVYNLRQVGYRGFLMGENFMKTEHPGNTLHDFISQLNKLS